MSVQAYEVPLIPAPQAFQIALSAIGYQFEVYWCWPAQCWMANLYDAHSQPLILGLPLTTGVDILGQFVYVGVPGRMVVQTDHNALVPPTFANLGIQSHLYYVPFSQVVAQ
jgi:hypothetical protein